MRYRPATVRGKQQESGYVTSYMVMEPEPESMRKVAHRFDSAGCSLDDDMQEIERHLQELGDDDFLSDDAFITFKTTETRCEELYERGVGLKS